MSFEEILVKTIQAFMGFYSMLLVFGLALLVGIVALITWIIKLVWKAEPKHRTEKEVPKREYKQPQNESPKWYPSGWTFNEETNLWDPPDYLSKESEEKWVWDPNKKIWIDKEREARLERYRKAHEGQPPSFEEWKAAKLREKEQESGED